MRSTKEFTRRVFAYIKQMNRDKELPSAAVRVGLVIADHWNEESGEAHPSLQTIALESGLGEGTVRRMLPALVECGHLAVQVGSRGSGHPNRYWPLDESANGGAIKSANEGVIENANGGVSAAKPKAPFSGIKAPSETKKAPTGALNTVEHTEHSKSAPPARSTARGDRGYAAETPNQRASDEALIDTVTAQNQFTPSASPIGTPANVAALAEAENPMQVGFDLVRLAYPQDRIGDLGQVFFAFCGALKSRGPRAVLKDFDSMRSNYGGGDVPFLADLLTTIERLP
ncbi:helix-turn-helix domain-containing protein [Bradyrhizobium septentrionale]|uniref:helix-turn-helix domain-containing protein n=1 Tax=Bradyrhizobium septentrionale TaxID=1404411 RepID=UPI001596AE77|nr:helix-turn-helix domain-containing protein [Bradyrhizobium septentrionale]UGY28171.1 helix-turn-helix domain-containing protein [Bradyrhizobium septentrionale]